MTTFQTASGGMTKRSIMKITQQPSNSSQGRRWVGVHERHEDRAFDVLRDVASLLVEARRAGCAGVADLVQVRQEGVDRAGRCGRRPADGVAHANDAARRVAAGWLVRSGTFPSRLPAERTSLPSVADGSRAGAPPGRYLMIVSGPSAGVGGSNCSK